MPARKEAAVVPYSRSRATTQSVPSGGRTPKRHERGDRPDERFSPGPQGHAGEGRRRPEPTRPLRLEIEDKRQGGTKNPEAHREVMLEIADRAQHIDGQRDEDESRPETRARNRGNASAQQKKGTMTAQGRRSLCTYKGTDQRSLRSTRGRPPECQGTSSTVPGTQRPPTGCTSGRPAVHPTELYTAYRLRRRAGLGTQAYLRPTRAKCHATEPRRPRTAPTGAPRPY